MERIYIDRFWSKVEKTDNCWHWKAGLNNGYGFFAIRKKEKVEYFFAHRLSWFLSKGAIPNGLFVLHKCDNRKCVNPEHLFLGNASANMRDKVSKGRQVKGSEVGSSKLNDEKVREILTKRPNTTIENLTRQYGVSRVTIINICKGRSWKHINRSCKNENFKSKPRQNNC